MKKVTRIIAVWILMLSILCNVASAGTQQNLYFILDNQYKGAYRSAVTFDNVLYIGTDAFKVLGYNVQTDRTKKIFTVINSKKKTVCKIDTTKITGADGAYLIENQELYMTIGKAAALLKMDYEFDKGKGTLTFFSSKAKKSQTHFSKALGEIDFITRHSSLKGKIDELNVECEKLDHGGELNEKKLKAQFEEILSEAKKIKKDIVGIPAEDASMKMAKNMLIGGYELLERAMEDLRKVTVTKDRGVFESYHLKVKKVNMFFSDYNELIKNGLQ